MLRFVIALTILMILVSCASNPSGFGSKHNMTKAEQDKFLKGKK